MQRPTTKYRTLSILLGYSTCRVADPGPFARSPPRPVSATTTKKQQQRKGGPRLNGSNTSRWARHGVPSIQCVRNVCAWGFVAGEKADPKRKEHGNNVCMRHTDAYQAGASLPPSLPSHKHSVPRHRFRLPRLGFPRFVNVRARK